MTEENYAARVKRIADSTIRPGLGLDHHVTDLPHFNAVEIELNYIQLRREPFTKQSIRRAFHVDYLRASPDDALQHAIQKMANDVLVATYLTQPEEKK